MPNGDSCTAGGFSYLNFLDYATGSYVPGANGNMVSTKIGSSLAVGINVIMLPGGKVVTIVTTADNQQLTQDTPVAAGRLRRAARVVARADQGVAPALGRRLGVALAASLLAHGALLGALPGAGRPVPAPSRRAACDAG